MQEVSERCQDDEYTRLQEPVLSDRRVVRSVSICAQNVSGMVSQYRRSPGLKEPVIGVREVRRDQ